VSDCNTEDHYYEISEEERICEIKFREGVFIFVSLWLLMSSINFLRTEIAWLNVNYTENIPLHVYSRFTPLIIHNIELFLNKFVTILIILLIFTGSKIF
jgi:hypothetical protein